MTEPDGGAPAPEQPPAWQQPSPSPAPGGFQAAAVEPGPAPGVAYADLTTRIIAYIIDSVILAVVFVIIGVAIIIPLVVTGGGLVGGLIGFTALGILALVAGAAYFIYTWTTMRASPGQKVMNLETVNAADGATLTRDQAMRRWAFLFGPSTVAQVVALTLGDLGILSNLISFALLAYSIYLLYTASQSSKRQGFHDVQAATVVVKRAAA